RGGQAMRVEPLTVGPIVGVTTDTTCRLWGRGPDEAPADQRIFGVGRATKAGASTPAAQCQFKMAAKFDYTGVGDLTGLAADRVWDSQVGCVRGPLTWDEVPAGSALDWSAASTGSFHTCVPPGTAQPVSFVFGSCRYLLLKWIFHWGEDSGDKAFRSIVD